MRNARDPLLDAFDLPLFFASESTRNTTTTPVQSLLLINSPQLVQYANSLAKEIDGQTKEAAWSKRSLHCGDRFYGREPLSDELTTRWSF